MTAVQAAMSVEAPPVQPARSGGLTSAARTRLAFRRSRTLVAGAVLVGCAVLVALLAPLLSPFDPVAQIAKPLLVPGALEHPLGTDELGRDELSRLMSGTRLSLYVGLLAVAIALAIGATSGIVAGFYGGWLDNLLMRLMDVLFSLPAIVLAIAITSILGPNLTNAMLAVGIVYAPAFARIARAPTLSVVQLPYIEAARAVGLPGWRIMLRHVLPNITAPLLVQTTVSLSTAILTEAALSFLGVGTQPPAPSWGLMLSAARQYMLLDPWIAILPGLGIALVVLGFNLLGDGLRDVLDPRIRTL
jgi:peptide/nickel transport system permease protein